MMLTHTHTEKLSIPDKSSPVFSHLCLLTRSLHQLTKEIRFDPSLQLPSHFSADAEEGRDRQPASQPACKTLTSRTECFQRQPWAKA